MDTDSILFLLSLGILMLACLISDGAYLLRLSQDAPSPAEDPNRFSHQLGSLLVLSGSLRRVR